MNDNISFRKNKGVEDILETEESVNGVFEIDEKYANGYHLYIPYGIHCDLHDAIEYAIRKIEKDLYENKDTIKGLNEKNEIHKVLIEQLKYDNSKFEKHIKVLRALNELSNDI
jgi:hypothetical protein